MSLCLAAAGLVVALGADAITLRWQHSVEKITWEEDWARDGRMVVMTLARVRGSGAGMEPPPESKLVDGAWQWTPGQPAQASLALRRSGATPDWQVCIQGDCKRFSALLPGEADPVWLSVCSAWQQSPKRQGRD
jgi:hypothetical protein